MEIKLFHHETIIKNEDKQNPFIKFTTDQNNKIFLFHRKNNSILYYNAVKSKSQTIAEYKSLSLVNFIILTRKKCICLLYSNGDLVFISFDFIENENFDVYWSQVASSKKQPSSSIVESHPNQRKEPKKNTPLFSEFLLCGNPLLLSSSLSVIKNFIIKNLFKDFLNDLDFDSNNIIMSSMCNWKNPKCLSDDNEYIILSYDYSLLILAFSKYNIITLEVSIHFYFLIYQIHFINTCNETYQYLIVQTEKDFYCVTLYDKDNNICVLEEGKGKRNINTPEEIPLPLNSILSVQMLNGERALCALTNDNSFDVYNSLDLLKPIIQIDLNDSRFVSINNSQKREIINCFLYEKMLLILIKVCNCYYIIGVNFWICSPTSINKKNSGKVWCNLDYNLLDDYIIFKTEINFRIVQYNIRESSMCISDYTNKPFAYLMGENNLIELVPINNNSLIGFVMKELKYKFDFEILRKIELLNNGLNGLLFDFVDLIISELPKQREILLKILWTQGEKDEMFYIEKIKNDKQLYSNSDLCIKLIDYFLYKIFDSKRDEGIKYIECLIFFYIKVYIEENGEMILNDINTKEQIKNGIYAMCMKFISREDEYNNKINKLNYLSSFNQNLIQLNNSFSESNDDEVNGNFLLLHQRSFISTIGNDNLNANAILIPESDNYPIKIIFEKVLLCYILSPTSICNIELIDDIDQFVLSSLVDFIQNQQCECNKNKALISLCLLNSEILLSDRFIEEVFILKFKSMLKKPQHLINFGNFISNIIFTNSQISIKTKALFNITQTKTNNEHIILSYLEKIILTYTKNIIIPNSSPINQKVYSFIRVILLYFLFYFYLFNESKNIHTDILNEFLFVFKKLKLSDNKLINSYYTSLIKSLQMSYKNNNYYTDFFSLIKEKSSLLQSNTISIDDLIISSDSDVFKQRKLQSILK